MASTPSQSQQKPTERVCLGDILEATIRKKGRKAESQLALVQKSRAEAALTDGIKAAFPCMVKNTFCGVVGCPCALLSASLALYAKETPEEKWLKGWVADRELRKTELQEELMRRFLLIRSHYSRALTNDVKAELQCLFSMKEEEKVGTLSCDALTMPLGKENKKWALLDLAPMENEKRSKLRKDVVLLSPTGMVHFRKVVSVTDALWVGKPSFILGHVDRVTGVCSIGDQLAQISGILKIAWADVNLIKAITGGMPAEAIGPLCDARAVGRAEGFEDLNKEQMDGMETALTSRVGIIIGPPGTGKTRLLAALASVPRKYGVLPVVTGPTNKSVEACVEKCVERGLRVLVLGPIEQLTGIAKEHCIAHLRTEDPRFAEVDRKYREGTVSYRRFKDELTKFTIELIESRDVVCGTAKAVLGSLWTNLPIWFLMDEAGAMREEWLPALLTASDAKKKNVVAVTFFGDGMQLQPYTQLTGTCVEGVLTRLQRAGNIPATLLKAQYRMGKILGQKISNRFYYRQLYCGGDQGLGEVVVRHHATNASSFEDGFSFYNKREVTLIRQTLLKKMQKYDDIAIVTFYKGQVSVLNKELADILNENVKVCTLDSVQGSEFDCCIVSIVSSDPESLFVTESSRVNVACSRAKDSLTVVGHVNHFEDGAWAFLLEPYVPPAPPGLEVSVAVPVPLTAEEQQAQVRAWGADRKSCWADEADE
jgi:hypothetical protein